jgi:hypothetical protein
MTRHVPAGIQFQNERQRNGFWFAVTQKIGAQDDLNFGWARAGKTPGDPGGQHNFDSANNDNSANMLTLAWKHNFDRQLMAYLNFAETWNRGNAHYDLGAGPHGVKVDCHDATHTNTPTFDGAGPTTWGGCRPRGVTAGIRYLF